MDSEDRISAHLARGTHVNALCSKHAELEVKRLQKCLNDLDRIKRVTPFPADLPAHIQKLYEHEPNFKNPNLWKILAAQIAFK